MVLEEVYAQYPNSKGQLANIANGRSILTLVVFFLSSKSRQAMGCLEYCIAENALDIVVIFPFRIPLPRIVSSASHNVFVKFRIFPRTSEPLRRPYISVNFLTGPMISVLLLLAVKTIDGAVLEHGIIGADGVEPISIMALFISLVRGRGFTASMCSSLVTPDGNDRHISPSP